MAKQIGNHFRMRAVPPHLFSERVAGNLASRTQRFRVLTEQVSDNAAARIVRVDGRAGTTFKIHFLPAPRVRKRSNSTSSIIVCPEFEKVAHRWNFRLLKVTGRYAQGFHYVRRWRSGRLKRRNPLRHRGGEHHLGCGTHYIRRPIRSRVPSWLFRPVRFEETYNCARLVSGQF